ncbi:chromosome segregation protein SMC [Trichlorobacter ammonificans]|uniref:Chromosome partition protein Smc n=1 Tax=Trichlorobacter ammonificans TaxID=2916410 RepID=A0ABM9DDY5_9BACT|nr:chromosome segregation protein SMC [Trichlorobacter ammonificans]CAH2032685.1 Chromosome partition protein Smc [Trichlorobacter ammonificans]
MRIKRLEIAGFKSFADRVVLDFQQGVTGVVGPNGCGKSNIVDAIRWCMGEQSAKNLRGKAMEDVIFAGSESRKPLGMAEVSLVFSTEDGRAPAKYLDFAEIQLTRRLYRDGESEYLLNKTPCRLLDITELFMDTGVGTRAYSIIEQGKIGQILHSRPEERRLLIEEAAGVTRYKARKQLALKKIESTRQNLLRLNDLIGEIRRQLGSLQRQAKKAEKFKEHRQELRDLELCSLLYRGRQVQAERAEAEQELARLNERMQSAFGAVTQAESRMEEDRLSILEAEKALNCAQEELYRWRSDGAACENGLQFRHKELTALEERLLRLDEELASLAFSTEGTVAQQTDTAARLQEIQQRLGEAEIELTTAQESLKEREAGFEAARAAVEQGRRELFTVMAEANRCRSQADALRKRQVALAEQRARYEQEQGGLSGRLAELTAQRTTLEAARSGLEQRRRDIAVAIETLTVREQQVKQQVPEAEKRWQQCHDELNRTVSRLKSLQELEAQFEGYGHGVRTLLKDAPLRQRLDGMLADRLEVPEELEAALEAVLGDRLQTVLCRAPDDALESLSYLRAKGGRAQLALPCGVVPALQQVADPRALPLLGRVTAPDSVRGLLARLLAETYRVDRLETALELGQQYPHATFVTTDGDLVTMGSLISGGSGEPVQSGIIHKKREIKALEERVGILEAALVEHDRERRELREAAQEIAQELAAARNDLHGAELELAGLTKDLHQTAGELERTGDRLKLNALDLDNLAEEAERLHEELETLTTTGGEADQRTRQLEAHLAEQGSGLEEQNQALALERERLTALRVSHATLREQIESLQRGTAAVASRLQELEQRFRQRTEERSAARDQRQTLLQEIETEEVRLKELLARQLQLEERLRALREAYEAAGARLAESDAAARTCRAESEAVRQQQVAATLRCSSLTLQLDNLDQNLQERHRLSLADQEGHPDVSTFDEAAARLRQQELERVLEELGDVNLMAIEEYAGMEERHRFLAEQKADLEESVQDLQQAIQKINKTTRKRFFDTFTQVNAQFSEIFPRLFCGGRAELRLTDEQDLLETGIDIIVQPPGKKLSNVMLLSGGEKALTAVALIFAIFLIKPTPFCLLDEVDAPLDDANIGRFNEMVREMSAISQFIIITHNKTTMAVADTLYGVTMEEPGASRLVSVKLH